MWVAAHSKGKGAKGERQQRGAKGGEGLSRWQQRLPWLTVVVCHAQIDFGGTSVWYHILRGAKTFWLVRPTKENLAKFERWSRNDQSRTFFGDLCGTECSVVHLMAGDTFMIPTGWIHAVYTSAPSLVFGGNFLHSFNIEGQLAISALEARLRVPLTYRFPLYEELHWFAAQHWCAQLLDDERTATGPAGVTDRKGCDSTQAPPRPPLSPHEASGLQRLAQQLQTWLTTPLVSAHSPPVPDALPPTT